MSAADGPSRCCGVTVTAHRPQQIRSGFCDYVKTPALVLSHIWNVEHTLLPGRTREGPHSTMSSWPSRGQGEGPGHRWARAAAVSFARTWARTGAETRFFRVGFNLESSPPQGGGQGRLCSHTATSTGHEGGLHRAAGRASCPCWGCLPQKCECDPSTSLET